MKETGLIAKIYIGFGLVLMLLMATSIVSYWGFSKVVLGVSKSVDIDMLNSQIHFIRLQEKNFIMRNDPIYARQVKKGLNDLIGIAQHSSVEQNEWLTPAQTQQIVSKANHYLDAFDHYYELNQQSAPRLEKMRQAARQIIKQAEAVRADQKMQLQQKVAESERQIEDKLTKADDANRIIKWTHKARIEEKNFMLRKSVLHRNKVEALAKQVTELALDMKSRFTSSENRAAADQVVLSANNYLQAFQDYASGKDKSLAEKTMVASARRLELAADSIRRDQKKQLAAVSLDNRAFVLDRSTKADDANRIIKWELDMRKSEKQFILSSGDDKWLGLVTGKLEQIKTLANQLKSRFKLAKNRQQIAMILENLATYQSELNQIDQLFQQKKEAEQQVINAARALQKVTEAALTSQRQQIDQHTRIAQGVITITGLLALILGCMLAWIIIRGVRDDIKKRQSAEQELLEANRQAQQQSHFKSGLADLNEVMRGEQVLNVLSENILNFLSRFLNLPISALYIKDDSDQLARTATFAYPQQSDQQKRYQMSEGMVGQAAQSATTLLIEPVEAIFSADLGIAEVVPAQLLFQPLIHNNNVIGVLELAALKPFEPAQRQWLDQAAVAIAVAIRMAIDLAVRQQSQVDLLNAKVNADSANRAKSDFLANMSHEIRTPMNAIISMSHLALKTDLSAKQRNYIEKVHLSAELLLGVINDILDFSKIEAKKLTMEQIPFQLENVLDNLANLVGMKAEEQGLELLFDTAHDIPSTLIGDPLRLGQVLVNLVNNAVKFTEQGEIVLTVRRLEQHQDRIKLQFSIRDTGIGMTPEQQNKLFQSFSQADTSTTRKFGGTGLGLTISKHLVEMMDGEVWVESEFGQGTTFHFTACFGCNTSSAEPPKLRHDLHGVHTLVVDDNPTAREIMATMLEGFGFSVTLAANGEAAIQSAEEAEASGEPFELVLMDWKMPKMDGIETTRRLQNVLPSDHSPAMIMVTAYGKDEVTEAAHDINVDNFLIKPVNPSTLFNTTMQALGHSVVAPTRTERQSEAISQAVTQLKGARILLVEDNAINQELALELLNSSEIEVTVANNGQEALDCLQHQAFDGILMDMQMPVMDGCTASRAIRQQPQFETVPIIAMTANAMAGDREKCQEAGMNDHIAKPIDVEAMFSTMAKWITVAQPPAATDQFPQQQADLLSLEGIIDSKIGLAAVKGDGQRYRKMLCKFRDQQHDLIEQFRQARNSAAADSAIRQLIVLKGMAGAIGAIEIRKAAEALESACQDDASEAQIDSLIIGLDQALKPVIAALEKLE